MNINIRQNKLNLEIIDNRTNKQLSPIILSINDHELKIIINDNHEIIRQTDKQAKSQKKKIKKTNLQKKHTNQCPMLDKELPTSRADDFDKVKRMIKTKFSNLDCYEYNWYLNEDDIYEHIAEYYNEFDELESIEIFKQITNDPCDNIEIWRQYFESKNLI